MKKARSILVTVLLLAVTVQVLWYTIKPALPYIFVALFLVLIFGTIWHRSTRW